MSGKKTEIAITMEVTTKGSFDHSKESLSRPSTSLSVNSMSLEYLPPEAPYFTMVVDVGMEEEAEAGSSSFKEEHHHLMKAETEDTDSVEGEGGELEDTDSVEGEREESTEEADSFEGEEEGSDLPEDDDLYHRIKELSDNIQQKLEASTGSYSKQTHDSHLAAEEGDSPLPLSPPLPLSSHVTAGASSSCDSRCSESTQFNDPRTQKAYEKMLKLDEKLASVCKKEKEVKRQRKLLEELMEKVGAGQPSSVFVSAGDSSGLVSPVFRTQPYEIVFEQQTSSQASETRLLAGAPPQESLDGRKNDNRKRKDAAQGGASKFETNFVKRNIELVADAAALVMMTKAEKQRLQELLDEEDMEVAELETDGDEPEQSMALCPVSNTHSAFSLAEKDMQRLRELDSQLEVFHPAGVRDVGVWDTDLLSPATPNDASPLGPRLPVVPHAPSSERGSAAVLGGFLSSSTLLSGEAEECDGGTVALGILSEESHTTSVHGIEEGSTTRCDGGFQHEVGVAGSGYQEVGVAGSGEGASWSERATKEDQENQIDIASKMELLRHLCIPHSEVERLKVIDEQLRLIHEENQSSFQAAVLDRQVLSKLIQQGRREQECNADQGVGECRMEEQEVGEGMAMDSFSFTQNMNSVSNYS